MPEIPDRREQFALKYDNMEDEQLRDILRADASKPEGEESDVDEIFYVMELLARRRAERGETRDPAKALEAFKKRYPNDLVVDEEDEVCSEKVIPYSGRSAGWKRRLVAAAAAAALIVVGVTSVSAAKFNLWETIAKWTQETFHWGTSQESVENAPTKDGTPPCAELQETLLSYDINEKLVPTWLPKGYSPAEVQIVQQPNRRMFYASYQCLDKYLIIQIQDYMDANPFQFEQSDSETKIYVKNDIKYYIFENNHGTQIAWINGCYECNIYGDYSTEEAEIMIDSITKG